MKALPPPVSLVSTGGGTGNRRRSSNYERLTRRLLLRLSRRREGGDPSTRAIWLFSRNDALANIAVVIAAGLVTWVKSAWPDLIVAAIIALLFLQSAWEIIRDALAELREPQAA